MMEVTGKGRACISGGLGLNQLNKICLKSRRKKKATTIVCWILAACKHSYN